MGNTLQGKWSTAEANVWTELRDARSQGGPQNAPVLTSTLFPQLFRQEARQAGVTRPLLPAEPTLPAPSPPPPLSLCSPSMVRGGPSIDARGGGPLLQGATPCAPGTRPPSMARQAPTELHPALPAARGAVFGVRVPSLVPAVPSLGRLLRNRTAPLVAAVIYRPLLPLFVQAKPPETKTRGWVPN